jgi:hypothetical protein
MSDLEQRVAELEARYAAVVNAAHGAVGQSFAMQAAIASAFKLMDEDARYNWAASTWSLAQQYRDQLINTTAGDAAIDALDRTLTTILPEPRKPG